MTLCRIAESFPPLLKDSPNPKYEIPEKTSYHPDLGKQIYTKSHVANYVELLYSEINHLVSLG